MFGSRTPRVTTSIFFHFRDEVIPRSTESRKSDSIDKYCGKDNPLNPLFSFPFSHSNNRQTCSKFFGRFSGCRREGRGNNKWPTCRISGRTKSRQICNLLEASRIRSPRILYWQRWNEFFDSFYGEEGGEPKKENIFPHAGGCEACCRDRGLTGL